MRYMLSYQDIYVFLLNLDSVAFAFAIGQVLRATNVKEIKCDNSPNRIRVTGFFRMKEAIDQMRY